MSNESKTTSIRSGKLVYSSSVRLGGDVSQSASSAKDTSTWRARGGKNGGKKKT